MTFASMFESFEIAEIKFSIAYLALSYAKFHGRQ